MGSEMCIRDRSSIKGKRIRELKLLIQNKQYPTAEAIEGSVEKILICIERSHKNGK